MTPSTLTDAMPGMSRHQIDLVRDGFAALDPRQTAATLFYARLFELAPEVRPLFPRDVSAQGAKLMAAVALIVDNLDRIDGIRPQIVALARRHVGYGATEAHYSVVGEALIWALKQGLGDKLTDEAREAWTAAYALLAGTMIAVSRLEDPAA
jgi:nitric oxide dioxygenase